MFSPELARDKNNTTPRDHVREEGPGKSHPAHHIGFEEAQPVGIRNLEERLWFEDADIVHEDIHLAELAKEALGARGAAEISRNAAYFHAGAGRNALDRVADFRVGSPVDDDLGAFPGETLRHGKADARSGARHERALALEFQIHGRPRQKCCRTLGILSRDISSSSTMFARAPSLTRKRRLYADAFDRARGMSAARAERAYKLTRKVL